MAENGLIALELITPAKIRFRGEVSEFTAPAVSGEVNVLAGHTLYMTRLDPGMVEITDKSGEKKKFAVYEGILEIEEDKAVILVEEAFTKDELDSDQIKKDTEESLEKIDSLQFGEEEYRSVELKLSRLKALQAALESFA